MGASSHLAEQSLASILLVLSFLTFAIGASLPLVGEKGNAGFFTLPTQEYLLAIANNALAWRWANILMGAAAVLLLAGLALLASLLDGANEQLLSRLGLAGIQIAALLWVIFSAWRGTVTISAAQEMATTGAIPAYFEPLAQWSSALFLAYAVIGYLSLMAFGGSLLQSGLLSSWVGWVTLLFSFAMLVLLIITGDTLPAFHYLPALLIGILLVVGR